MKLSKEKAVVRKHTHASLCVYNTHGMIAQRRLPEMQRQPEGQIWDNVRRGSAKNLCMKIP